MTPGESHNEWYHYYCSIFYVFNDNCDILEGLLHVLVYPKLDSVSGLCLHHIFKEHQIIYYIKIDRY